jgi:RNA polymerase sigma-70 factor (ECF subfamily)
MLSPAPATVESEVSDVPDLAQLLSAARANDPDAYGELCRVYETRLLRQAMRLCGNVAMAEDLAQDTLVEAWKCLRRYNGRCQFFTWLCAILLNRFRNTLREKRGLAFVDSTSETARSATRSDQLVDESSSPDETARLREEALIVRKCICALTPKHRQVVYLRFFVDDSLEGIAAALHCSVGTVKSRLFHALEKLRAMNALREQRPERAQQIRIL